MDCLKHVLSLVVLCCCRVQTSDAKNVFIFEVDKPTACGSAANQINVTLTSSLHEIDPKFLSVALGSRFVTTYLLGSEKLINMAAALAPVELRLGGTSANFLTYIPASSSRQTEERSAASEDCGFDEARESFTEEEPYQTVTASQWTAFNTFLKKANWDLLFDVNNFKWTSSGAWDTTNFEQLLNDSSAKGVPIAHFQLGNEPSAYKSNFGVTVLPETLVKNFKTLKAVISRYPLYASSKVCGPDVSNIVRQSGARNYLRDFLNAGANDVIDEISLHHYYVDGKATSVDEFVSPATMDKLKTLYDMVSEMNKAVSRARPVQLTETSSGYGGGAFGLSDAYVAGFLWLDKLGLSATRKATRIFRQSLFGGAYGLVTSKYEPNPDYFLSLLYKILVEGPVFNVALQTGNAQLRVYANCASRKRYAAGALVVYYLNLADTEAVLSLPQFPGANLDLYLLTPGDDSGLLSRYVKLNGNKLVLSGNQLPALTAKPHTGDVTVEAKTFGFIVVPGANVSFCVSYFNRLDSNSQGN